MRRDDHLVGVGAGQHGVEEGLGVSQTVLRNHDWVRHKPVTPAHGEPQLAAALDEEQRCRGHLQSSEAHTELMRKHVKLPRRPLTLSSFR